MSEEKQARSSEIEVDQKVEQPDLITCPRCGSERFKRIARAGLLNKYIYPIIGRYPWKCGRCGATTMMKKRSAPRRHRRRSSQAEEHGAKTPPLETSSQQ